MNRIRKNRLLAIVFLLSFSNFGLMAQMDGGPTIVDAKGLYNTIKNDRTNPSRDFCQEVEVTVDLIFGEIETTINIYCDTEYFICFPAPSDKMQDPQGEYPNDLEITNSASIVHGKHRIKIKTGKYKMDSGGKIKGLQYVISKI